MSNMERAGNLLGSLKDKFELLLSLKHLDDKGVQPADIMMMCDLVKDIAQLNLDKLSLQPYEDEAYQQLMVEHYQEVLEETDELIAEIRSEPNPDEDDIIDYMESLEECFTLLSDELPDDEPPSDELPDLPKVDEE